MEAEEAWKTALGHVQLDVDRSWFDQYPGETHVVSHNYNLFGVGEFDDFSFDCLWDLLTSTVIRVLVEGELIEDLTPSIPHRLHVYAYTDGSKPFEQIGIRRDSFYEEKGQNQQVGKGGQNE